MSKSKISKGKLVRKFGENIFGNPKFDNLLNKKPYTPGQHGPTRRKRLSNYGQQLNSERNNETGSQVPPIDYTQQLTSVLKEASAVGATVLPSRDIPQQTLHIHHNFHYSDHQNYS